MKVTYRAHLVDLDGFEKTIEVSESQFMGRRIQTARKLRVSATRPPENLMWVQDQVKRFYMDPGTYSVTTFKGIGMEEEMVFRATFKE